MLGDAGYVSLIVVHHRAPAALLKGCTCFLVLSSERCFYVFVSSLVVSSLSALVLKRADPRERKE